MKEQKHVMNESLFPIIHQINKLHLCKPLIRAIDSSNLKNDYSPAQKVTYKYYVGRKAMFDSDFKPGNIRLAKRFETTSELKVSISTSDGLTV